MTYAVLNSHDLPQASTFEPYLPSGTDEAEAARYELMQGVERGDDDDDAADEAVERFTR